MKALKNVLITTLIGISILALCGAIVYVTERDNVELIARLDASGVSRADATLAYGTPKTKAKTWGEAVLDADATSRTVVTEGHTEEINKACEAIWVVRDDPRLTYYTIDRGLCTTWAIVAVVEVPQGVLPTSLTDEGEARLARIDDTKKAIDDAQTSATDIAREALERATFPAFCLIAVAFFAVMIHMF